jgi:hypothetical protein
MRKDKITNTNQQIIINPIIQLTSSKLDSDRYVSDIIGRPCWLPTVPLKILESVLLESSLLHNPIFPHSFPSLVENH